MEKSVGEWRTAINTPFTGVRLSKYPYRSLEMASEAPKGLLSGAETVVII